MGNGAIADDGADNRAPALAQRRHDGFETVDIEHLLHGTGRYARQRLRNRAFVPSKERAVLCTVPDAVR